VKKLKQVLTIELHLKVAVIKVVPQLMPKTRVRAITLKCDF
jgi:hypothetical protein